MGEVGNALKLLTILQCKGESNSEYLAKRLEVSKRQIYRYIKQLEESGIYIKSKRGRYGGYSLEKNQFINFNVIKEKELEIIKIACKNLIGKNFTNDEEVQDIIEKLTAVKNNIADTDTLKKDKRDYYIIKDNVNTFNEGYIKKFLEDIRSCINTKEKLEILYDSNSSEKSYRKLHPYGMFSYLGDTYLVAYCEKRKAIRNFKINRILEHKIIEDETYKIIENFEIKKYIEDSFGVFQDKKIHFKLKIKHPFSTIIKEKEHIKNEKITEIDDKTLIYEAKTRGKTEIISWILSMKTYCEVLEPEDFRQEVKEITEDMLEIYK